MDGTRFLLPSAGPLVIAAIAVLLAVFQWQLSAMRSRSAWDPWGALLSVGTAAYAAATFVQYNATAAWLLRATSQTQMTSIAFIIVCLGRYSETYLGLRSRWLLPATVGFAAAGAVLSWGTGLIVARSVMEVHFLLLPVPYRQAALGPLAPVFLGGIAAFGIGLFITWIRHRHVRRVPGILFVALLVWLVAGLMDALSNVGSAVPSLIPTAEYGFLGFSLSVLTATVKSYVALFDLAESRRRDMERAMTEAERASRAKTVFLATMSHELRTPLNHVIGFTELVASEGLGPLAPVQVEYLNDALSSSRHLLLLLNDILDVARVESGRVQLDWAPVPTEELMAQAVGLVREACAKHALALVTEVEQAPATFHGDRRRLSQVLLNLLDNAVKFTPDGGTITVSARAAVLEGAPCIEVSVADSGIGVAPADQERIFRAFEQGDSDLSRPRTGTGLGLPISRELVRLHGGRLWVESRGAGHGSVFRFQVPLARAGSPGAR